jgi:hypothetical protein
MTRQQPIELFMPPNMLKAKVGGSGAGLDMSAIQRAEQAMDGLKTEFADWIADGVRNLTEARDGFAANANDATFSRLCRIALDLKGQAQTLGYPLAGRVAASLSLLLEGRGLQTPPQLIDAHVEAIRVIVRDNVKENAHRVAVLLATELESRVVKALPEKKKKA